MEYVQSYVGGVMYIKKDGRTGTDMQKGTDVSEKIKNKGEIK